MNSLSSKDVRFSGVSKKLCRFYQPSRFN